MLLGEAVVIVFASKMEFADEIDGESSVSDFVVPSTLASVVGECVVPIANFVHVFAGCERSAGGDANRAGGVCSGETSAASGESIEIRCDVLGVAVAACYVFLMLV